MFVRFIYYVLDDEGEPLACDDVIVWAKWFETAQRVVARTRIDNQTEVSTVFLGLDHRFGAPGAPLLFETLVFGGKLDGEQKRYTSRVEAEAGHVAMVRASSQHMKKGS